MHLATMTANSPAMTIAAPQARFLTPASIVPSLGAQVRGSSPGGGMGSYPRTIPDALPTAPSVYRFQVAGQPLPRLTSGYGTSATSLGEPGMSAFEGEAVVSQT